MRQLNALQPGVDIEAIVTATGEMYDVDPAGILVKGKKRNFARDMAIYLSRKLSRQSGKDLGQCFGNISGSAIAIRSKAVGKRLQEDKKLKKQIKKIEERIINY